MVVPRHQGNQHVPGRSGNRLHDPRISLVQLHFGRSAPACLSDSVRAPVFGVRVEFLSLPVAELQSSGTSHLHYGRSDGAVPGRAGIHEYVGPPDLCDFAARSRGPQSLPSLSGPDRANFRRDGPVSHDSHCAGIHPLYALLLVLCQLGGGHRSRGDDHALLPYVYRLGGAYGSGWPLHCGIVLADSGRP